MLQEHEAGASVTEICRRHWVREQTLDRWKPTYGSMARSDVQRLKALEAGNARLKRLLAEQARDNQMLKDLLAKKLLTPAACRSAVQYLEPHSVISERRACRLVGMQRPALHYQAQPKNDEGLKTRLRELAVERPRFGYRRLHVLPRREGSRVNHKRIHRLYRNKGLAVG